MAALLVVFFHSSGNLAKDKYFGVLAEPIEKIFWFGGEAGVAFFFVLSGFIIHQVHRKEFDQPEKLVPYIQKRAVRVYPTYLIIFIGVFLLAKLTPSLRDTMPTDPIVLLKSLLLLPQDSKVVGGTGAPVLIVAWSLQYEILFYATFAIALINRWIFYSVVFIFLLNILLAPMLGPYNFPRSMVSSHLVFLFGMGMTSSKLLQSKYELKSTNIIVALSAFAFLAIGIIVTLNRASYSKPLSDLAYGLVSAILVFSLARFERQGKTAPFIKRIAFLGDSSYALYLIHFPLVAILSKIAVRILPMSVIGANLAFLLLVAGSVTVATAFHIVIEKPLLRRLTPKPSLQRTSGNTKLNHLSN